MIVGYQPSGGLGRELIDGADRVRIMGREVRVRARVATVGGLSAHAGRAELLEGPSRGAGGGAAPGARRAPRARVVARRLPARA